MQAPDFWLDREKIDLAVKELKNLVGQLKDWQNLKANLAEIKDLAELAQAENDDAMLKDLNLRFKKIEKDFKQLEFFTKFTGRFDQNNAILSIYAGAGGVDAQDWAEMLLRMYLRFSEKKGWSVKILDQTKGGEAGLKSVTLEISGSCAYGFLKSEKGVHRLVRISPYDAEKMRHTSFALVEVLPAIENDNEIEIKDEDLKIEFFGAGGAGGQNVNKTSTAVRLTHLPTGLIAKCQNERSQLQNRIIARKILIAKLFDLHQQKSQAEIKQLKGQPIKIEWGSQIRSYVLHPYHLVKDHRTEYETAQTDKVLAGEIDQFIEEYLNKIQNSKLKAIA